MILIFCLGMRAAKHLVSNADGKIKQYEDKFRELKAAFQGHAIVHIETIVSRSLNQVESLGASLMG